MITVAGATLKLRADPIKYGSDLIIVLLLLFTLSLRISYRVPRSDCSPLYNLGPNPSYSAFTSIYQHLSVQNIPIKVPLGSLALSIYYDTKRCMLHLATLDRIWISEGEMKNRLFFSMKNVYKMLNKDTCPCRKRIYFSTF